MVQKMTITTLLMVWRVTVTGTLTTLLVWGDRPVVYELHILIGVDTKGCKSVSVLQSILFNFFMVAVLELRGT